MTQNKKSNKKIVIIFAAVLVVVALALGAVFLLTRPEAQAGAKTLTVEMVVDGQVEKTFEFKTDEEFLGPALMAQGIVEGETGEFGLFITAVDGRAADNAKGEWWVFTKDGEDVMTGADVTPIADGDKFELILTVF